jgi:hypothetical protein
MFPRRAVESGTAISIQKGSGTMSSAHRRRLGLGVTLFAFLTLAAAPAGASAAACASASTTKAFLPWLDVADYVSAPGGDLESAGSWQLDGGATLVAGNEPFHVGGAGDSGSLRLPAGASATTAPMCVGLEHPTLRFFARRESASLLGLLQVDALVDGQALPIGAVTSGGSWAPTLPMPIVLNALGLLGSTEVAFRFTPLLGSRWSVDDVYVDPYRTN